MTERTRQQQIDDLEDEILQQRLDMTSAMREWRDATAPIDHAWEKIMSWKESIIFPFFSKRFYLISCKLFNSFIKSFFFPRLDTYGIPFFYA